MDFLSEISIQWKKLSNHIFVQESQSQRILKDDLLTGCNSEFNASFSQNWINTIQHHRAIAEVLILKIISNTIDKINQYLKKIRHTMISIYSLGIGVVAFVFIFS